jgi:hypothetical protein
VNTSVRRLPSGCSNVLDVVVRSPGSSTATNSCRDTRTGGVSSSRPAADPAGDDTGSGADGTAPAAAAIGASTAITLTPTTASTRTDRRARRPDLRRRPPPAGMPDLTTTMPPERTLRAIAEPPCLPVAADPAVAREPNQYESSEDG